ncbi:hypothetical protein QAD02_021522 [Eretmocerus hayati]|uniref:Uncharacterized protein n=1 Tax=Eretmocerus hayati TaxID=131215 RepID=A0ACC2PSY9_9HYME|nr:hypothetical protein QAD02_021522 [Eretmocerus hayati]
MARSKKRTDDPPDSERLNLGKQMNELISRDPRYLPIAKLVLGLSFAGLIERLNQEGLSDRGTRLTLHNRLIRHPVVYDDHHRQYTEYNNDDDQRVLWSNRVTGANATHASRWSDGSGGGIPLDMSRDTVRLLGERDGTSPFDGRMDLPTHLASGDAFSDSPTSPDPRNPRLRH